MERDTLRDEIARTAPYANTGPDGEYTGDVYCDDPTHPSDCDCGATPDRDYERGLDL